MSKEELQERYVLSQNKLSHYKYSTVHLQKELEEAREREANAVGRLKDLATRQQTLEKLVSDSDNGEGLSNLSAVGLGPLSRTQNSSNDCLVFGGTHHALALPKLEPLTGKSQDKTIEEWLHNFANICASYGVQSSRQPAMFRLVFKGAALTRFRRYSPGVKDDIQWLKKHLISDFGGNKNDFQRIWKYNRRKQRCNETVLEYACALENLYLRVFGPIQSEKDRLSLKFTFLEGVNPAITKILKLFVHSLPNDWDELVKLASLHENRAMENDECGRTTIRQQLDDKSAQLAELATTTTTIEYGNRRRGESIEEREQ